MSFSTLSCAVMVSQLLPTFSNKVKMANDFEDYLQCLCAQEFDCDVIITNNTKHFTDTHIPVHTPSEFLAVYK